MAIRNLSKKPYINDRNKNISIGLELPLRKSNSSRGWFETSDTTLTAVKNNVQALLLTQKGERLMQPNLGLNLRKYLFEQMTADTIIQIENDIVDAFQYWLPFVDLKDLKVIESKSNNNGIDISVTFNIKKDPRTTESIQVSIGE
tara:strand:- start:2051 stop:2485 length:435 start_codon:yes stop_codon:yes gene_type:complete